MKNHKSNKNSKSNQKDQYYLAKMVNMILGVLILGLILLSFIKKDQQEIYYLLIFALAAVENFVAATMSFAEKKSGRGNLYAVIGGVFLVVAIAMGLKQYHIL